MKCVAMLSIHASRERAFSFYNCSAMHENCLTPLKYSDLTTNHIVFESSNYSARFERDRFDSTQIRSFRKEVVVANTAWGARRVFSFGESSLHRRRLEFRFLEL